MASTPKPPPPFDHRQIVQSVDPKTNTVVIIYMGDKSKHTYTIDDMTVLTVNNQKGKITDIKPTMVVDDYSERDFESLDSLTVSGYPADPKAKKK